MTLDQWLTDNEKSGEAFGTMIGVTGQAVRRYRTGERMPDAQVANRIVEATDSAVTIQDLHDTRLAFLNKSVQSDAERPAA